MVWPFKWKLFSSTFTWYYLYAVLTFESVEEILWCDHSNETSSAVLSHGTIYLVCSSNFWVCGWNPMVWPFKWNLFSSTFTWYYLYAVLTFESVDKLLWCDHPNETSSAVLLHGTIYLGCSSNYQAFGRNPIVWHSKSNLFSSTFTWSLLCFGILQNFNKKLAPLGLKWKSGF